jgi:RNA polymerase sigma-70 factor (ECF subfamily)
MAEGASFQQLVARIRAGDNDAAAELVRRYEPAIRRVARIRLGEAHLRHLLDSLDICQSVFASFFVRAALGDLELDSPEGVLNLLVAMTRRKVVDQVRRASAARRDYRRNHSVRDADRCVAATPPPSEQVAAEELLHEFRRRLSSEERHLAEQRAAGRDWSVIASECGGSPEALRKQLARAVERVSAELGLDLGS